MHRSAQFIQSKGYVTFRSFAIQKISAEVLWKQEYQEKRKQQKMKKKLLFFYTEQMWRDIVDICTR